jgi:hypothetical protein
MIWKLMHPAVAGKIAVADGLTYTQAMYWYIGGAKTRTYGAKKLAVRQALKESKTVGEAHRKSGLPRSTFYRIKAKLAMELH